MYVRVRVFPGSKKERILKTADGRYEMQVKEPAEQNLANKRIRQLLASEYDVNDSNVRIVSGHQSQTKIFDVVTK